jgi:hypothetical protein
MAKKFKPEQVEGGFNALFSSFLNSVVALVSFDKKIKELNYVKKTITLPNGGIYLVSVLHIDGPKFDMEQYRLVAESQEEKTNEPG